MTNLAQICESGRLSATPAEAQRHLQTIEALRKFHDMGWQDPYQGQVNPLKGKIATDARKVLSAAERALTSKLWILVEWMVIDQGDIEDCAILITDYRHDTIHWLRYGLCRIEPIVNPRKKG